MLKEYSQMIRFLPFLILLLRKADSQALDPNVADFSTVDGYDDLTNCVQECLGGIGIYVDCSLNAVGHYTNACLCRPSTLSSAVTIIQQKAEEQCQNSDDKNVAKTVLLKYCASKGYTSVVTPGVLPSSTGGYTVTATVTQISTLTAFARSSSTSDANRLPSSRRDICFGTVILAVLFLTPLYGRWLTTRSP